MKGLFSLLALILGIANGFAPVSTALRSKLVVSNPSIVAPELHPTLSRTRHSVAQTKVMGLFGLGAPEIAVVLVAAAFLLGPEKLASLGKDAGKIAGELKEVPKEFQEGLKEGEAAAAKMKQETSKQIEDATIEDKKE